MGRGASRRSGSRRWTRRRLVDKAGGVEAPDFAERFRAGLRERLAAERGAGKATATVAVGDRGGRTAQRVRAASRELPESWVRAGDALPLTAIAGSPRGFLRSGGGVPNEISVARDPGNPLHEYVHHLQRAMPRLDDLFFRLHLRRTVGEPRVTVGGPGEIGRRDQYINSYAGREYGPGQRPREVFTMGMQQLFFPVWGEELLRDLARKDPEMLDLLIGVLFRYDP